MGRRTNDERTLKSEASGPLPLCPALGSFSCVLILAVILLSFSAGCGAFTRAKTPVESDEQFAAEETFAPPSLTHIERPDVEDESLLEAVSTPAPVTLTEDGPQEYWDLRLEEAIRLGLANSKIMRDLGGVLRSPATVRTIHDPALIESDPRFGVEAALSAFDPTFSTSYYAERNYRGLNNTFFGGGTRLLAQDVTVLQSQLTKQTAQGTQLTLRQETTYDANNAPGNQFPHAYDIHMETEFRQPFLQGAGTDFNRIIGPGGLPGFAAGVLVARMNTDVSLADFEIGVRNLVSDMENAYWDLYFSYRDLNAKIAARDAALETWRRINALYVAGRRGGEAEKEADAREQYFRLEEEVKNATTGRLLEGTRGNNGSSGGTFRATSGVHVAERRLRLLMCVPINDSRLIRPADEPRMPKMVYDWELILPEALERRPELRRQRWLVKKREMELQASRNYLLPKLDAIGRYRWRGFGKDFLEYNPASSQNPEVAPFDSALTNLMSGQFQEWQLGAEFSVPLGNRRGHATVRNAELQLAREKILLREQEREVTMELSNGISELNRAYSVLQTNYNRREASKEHLAAVQAAFDADNAPLELLLAAQRRMAEAESNYHRTLVEYALAIKNVHFEKGSLLDYNEVYLAEGHWPTKAYKDAEQRDALRYDPLRAARYLLSPVNNVSRGEVPQQTLNRTGGDETRAGIMVPAPDATPALPVAPPQVPAAAEELPPAGEEPVEE